MRIAPKKGTRGEGKPPGVIEPLEPRILLSADFGCLDDVAQLISGESSDLDPNQILADDEANFEQPCAASARAC